MLNIHGARYRISRMKCIAVLIALVGSLSSNPASAMKSLDRLLDYASSAQYCISGPSVPPEVYTNFTFVQNDLLTHAEQFVQDRIRAAAIDYSDMYDAARTHSFQAALPSGLALCTERHLEFLQRQIPSR